MMRAAVGHQSEPGEEGRGSEARGQQMPESLRQGLITTAGESGDGKDTGDVLGVDY
jgi:hypothetical protein